jgi:putative phosphoesterase
LTTLIGVISDTHDLLRPEALAALAGSELILHAGDVCRPEVLEELERVAPVVAVRGNNDRGSWARALPLSRTLDVSGFRLHVIHDLKELAVDPKVEGYHAVLSGHSHQPRAQRRNGVLYLNPGSAGPRRFKLPVALARLSVGKAGLRARIVELAV